MALKIHMVKSRAIINYLMLNGYKRITITKEHQPQGHWNKPLWKPEILN